MRFEFGVYRWPDVDPLALGRQLRDEGWRVYFLPDEVTDKNSFFEGVVSTLPLDPELHPTGDPNWDALSDSLWTGLLHEVDADKIAIIWPNSRKMIKRDPEEFGIAFETLYTTIDLLADNEATVGHPKQVIAVLT